MSNVSVLDGEFSRNPSKGWFTYGMALQPPSAASYNAGEQHWYGSDSKAYVGTVIIKNITSATLPLPNSRSVSSPSMVFDIDGWGVFVVGGNSIQSGSQNLRSSLDGYILP